MFGSRSWGVGTCFEEKRYLTSRSLMLQRSYLNISKEDEES